MPDHNISIPPNGAPTTEKNCKAGQTVIWTNKHASRSVSFLTFPGCLTPATSPVSVPHGQPTPDVYTVRCDVPHGPYGYSYQFDPTPRQKHKTAPTTGTIDVS